MTDTVKYSHQLLAHRYTHHAHVPAVKLEPSDWNVTEAESTAEVANQCWLDADGEFNTEELLQDVKGATSHGNPPVSELLSYQHGRHRGYRHMSIS